VEVPTLQSFETIKTQIIEVPVEVMTEKIIYRDRIIEIPVEVIVEKEIIIEREVEKIVTVYKDRII
jgi:hypothetical protein